MAADLTVETDLIRRSADVLDEASVAFDPGCEPSWECPLTDGSLGTSAVAREVAGSAARRVLQACAAARSLSTLAAEAAGGLRITAAAFDAAESAAVAEPR